MMKRLLFLLTVFLIMQLASGCSLDAGKQENSTVYAVTQLSHQTVADIEEPVTDIKVQTDENFAAGMYDTPAADIGPAADTGSNGNTDTSGAETVYERKQIEEYYPLHEGASFEPRYAWDPVNYWERVVLRHGDLALLLCTYGGRGSDIEVYQITDDSVYEVYKLAYEYKESSNEYREIMNLIDENNRHKLIEFLEMVRKASSQKKTVLKYPLKAGTAWEGGGVVTPHSDELVAKMPEWLMKSGKITDKDVFVLKTDAKEGYFVYKKNVGIVAYYNPIILQFQE